MPKALPGVRSIILEVARKQLCEGGYNAMTLRSVSAECNIAIGTIYHYFASKDELLLALIDGQWLSMLSGLSEKCLRVASAREAIQYTYDALSEFFGCLYRVLKDVPATSYDVFSPRKHRERIREQLTKLLQPTLDQYSRTKNPFLSVFICDAVIFESENKRPFADFYSVISPLFKDAA